MSISFGSQFRSIKGRSVFVTQLLSVRGKETGATVVCLTGNPEALSRRGLRLVKRNNDAEILILHSARGSLAPPSKRASPFILKSSHLYRNV